MKGETKMFEVKGFQNTDFNELVREVNEFLGAVAEDKLIDIKYSSVPMAASFHTEYGIHPDSKYTALIILRK
jgi:hypothetical protein